MKEDLDSLCQIHIKLILNFSGDFCFAVYLKLSKDKVVKLSHHEENAKETLKRYHLKKNVNHVFISKKDYKTFMELTKNGLTSKFFDPTTTEEEKIDLLDKGHEMLKTSLNTIGISKESIEMAEVITKQSIKLVNRTPNLFRFLKQFEETCSEEYLRSIMVGYTTVCMIDTFEWKSDAIKEKASLAATLCDITLESKHFEELRIYEESNNEVKVKLLSQHVFDHPTKIIEMLTDENAPWIAKETLTIIEQHHELPFGGGFPSGINHSRISLLSAIFIVAYKFIFLLNQYKFDFKKTAYIFAQLEKEYGKGTGRKAIDALRKMLGM